MSLVIFHHFDMKQSIYDESSRYNCSVCLSTCVLLFELWYACAIKLFLT